MARLLTACFLCAWIVVALVQGNKQTKLHEDAILQTPQLLVKYGYPAEVHHVTTEDGYILEMHRIPYGKLSPAAPDKPAVFMHHGLTTSSADWILMGTQTGLGYMLADLGYDVWLGNNRGNFYSRKHVTLDPDVVDSPFWNYTFHEIGVYDLPAEIDYILETTGQASLVYIGHSEGTTAFFAGLSEKPEYNAKITAMFGLAPVAYGSHMSNPLVLDLLAVMGPEEVEAILGVQELLPHSDLIISMGDKYCRDEALLQPLCDNILFLICGYDSDQLNETMMPIIFGHAPAGSSSKQLLHYLQLIDSAKFEQYDYGVANMDHYGQETPPKYDLSKITCPVYLHYGLNDYLCSKVDVEQLHSELGNSAGMFEVPYPQFNHLDFLWAIDVNSLLYDLLSSQIHQATIEE